MKGINMSNKFHSLLQTGGIKVELKADDEDFLLTLPSEIKDENEAFILANHLDSLLQSYMEATDDELDCADRECEDCEEFDPLRPCFLP